MNAVVQPQKLETVFDHNITKDELRKLLYGDTESLEEYTQFLDQDGAYADIAQLLRSRGDNDKALKYISMITDNELRTQYMTTPCVIAGRSFAEQ
jgi:hypothetical protein